MRVLTVAGIALVLIGVGVEVKGQPPPPIDEAKPKKLIETMRIWRMTEELDLSEEQISKFFPKLKSLDDAKEEFFTQRAGVVKDLAQLLKSAKPSIAAVEKKLGELEEVEQGFEKKRAKLKRDMRDILSVEQQARLVVFEFNFEREIKEIIRDIKRHRGGHPGLRDEKMRD